MLSRNISVLMTFALSMLYVRAETALAAPLPIDVTAIPLQAADGNSNEAVILVTLSNTDGSAKANAEIPKLGADPNGGVELKGSKWSFETLAVPEAYSGRIYTDFRQMQSKDLRGQLRIMQVYALVNALGTAEEKILYVFRLSPRYGFQGANKLPLPWRAGTYTFRVSYKDGNDQGTALGSLIIPAAGPAAAP